MCLPRTPKSTTSTTVTPPPVTRIQGPPPAKVPVPPPEYDPNAKADYRSAQPRSAELASIGGAAEEVGQFADYTAVLGKTAPPADRTSVLRFNAASQVGGAPRSHRRSGSTTCAPDPPRRGRTPALSSRGSRPLSSSPARRIRRSPRRILRSRASSAWVRRSSRGRGAVHSEAQRQGDRRRKAADPWQGRQARRKQAARDADPGGGAWSPRHGRRARAPLQPEAPPPAPAVTNGAAHS